MITYKKILVTGSALKFEPGVILGLDSRMQTRFDGYIERVVGEDAKNSNGMAKREWKVTVPIVLRKGDIVWADERSLPKNGGEIFEEIYMAKTYQEMALPNVPKPDPVVAKIKTSGSSRDREFFNAQR